MQSHTSLHRRVSKPSALLGAFLVLTSIVPAVSARSTSYTDVPSGSYYEDAAANLLDLGALDSNEVRLRPNDLATRAELVKLLVNLRQNDLQYPARASFNDVARGMWYFPYFESAAKSGWVRGDGNCYLEFSPCTARPAGLVNRAEAATLLVRVFALGRNDLAPDFLDNSSNQWYYANVQAAADHCVLQGDGNTGLVRPGASMNRAEMVVMFDRAYRNLQYGEDCGVRSAAAIQSVLALSSNRVRVVFSQDVNEASATNASRYSILRTSNQTSLDVRSATWVNNRTVELNLDESIAVNSSYQLSVTNLMGANGLSFSDTDTFVLTASVGHVSSVAVLASDRVRVTYDTDVDATSVATAGKYTVTRLGGGQSISASSATVVNARTVDVKLSSAMTMNTGYIVHAADVKTSAGVVFTDDFDFTYVGSVTGHITLVTPLSSVRLRLTFDIDQDETRAEETNRYTVNDGTKNLVVQNAVLTSARTVELTLDEALSSQRSYTVTARDLLTMQGVQFSSSGSAIYDTGNVLLTANLLGSNEVPAVVSPMSGTGTFTLTATGLQYDITVKNATATGSMAISAAHFHIGAVGENGSNVRDITFTNNRAVGTWVLSAEHRNALMSGRIYANVHTTLHPNGEIRGQLIKQ